MTITTTTTTIFDTLETGFYSESMCYLIDCIAEATADVQQASATEPDSVQAVVRASLDGILQSAKELKVLLDRGHGDTGWQSDRCASMEMLTAELIKISTYATAGIDAGWEVVG